MNDKVTKQAVIKAMLTLLADIERNKMMAIAREDWQDAASREMYASGVRQAMAIVELLDEC